MAKLTPKKTFILRVTNGVRTIAKKGIKVEVSDDEHRNMYNYFVEPYVTKKKGLSVN